MLRFTFGHNCVMKFTIIDLLISYVTFGPGSFFIVSTMSAVIYFMSLIKRVKFKIERQLLT